VTDREGSTVELEGDHRAHANVETVIRDLKEGSGLAHLPSGKVAANAAWLAFATLARNLARWVVGIGLPNQMPARTTTDRLRRHLFSLPCHRTSSAHRQTIHLPEHWALAASLPHRPHQAARRHPRSPRNQRRESLSPASACPETGAHHCFRRLQRRLLDLTAGSGPVRSRLAGCCALSLHPAPDHKGHAVLT
jgi:hypothetical protein